RERFELATAPEAEFQELVSIYEGRGLSRALALQVATELSASDQLTVHAREELGIDPDALANPMQAAVTSALCFVVGAILPIIVVALVGESARVAATMGVTLVALVALGATGAHLGGAPTGRAAVRVFVGGVLALAISLGIGRLTGSVV
ncbi:MAG: VIT family protein, partial [Actinobacteria bacterium]|nr:VIT family protein [Actinomycetota bacterium]